MEGMVRLSFYLFAAASVSVAAAWVSYVVYAVGFIRLRRTSLATTAGMTVNSASTLNSDPPSAERWPFRDDVRLVCCGLRRLRRTHASGSHRTVVPTRICTSSASRSFSFSPLLTCCSSVSMR